MKKTKKLLSILLMLAILLTLAVPAFAADPPYSVTIKSTDGAQHTYEAYQFFAGDYSVDVNGKKILSNIDWGKDSTGAPIDGANLLAQFKANDNLKALFTMNTITAPEMAKILGGITSDSEAAEIAKVFEAYIAANNLAPIASATTALVAGKTDEYQDTTVITGLTSGYYFIKDKDKEGEEDPLVEGAYTRFILQVVGDNITVDAKTDVPSVSKKVQENKDSFGAEGSWNDAADYSVGDSIPYRLIGLVPDLTHYDTYWYEFEDTLGETLLLDKTSIKVYYVAPKDGQTTADVETSTAVGAGGALIDPSQYTAPNANTDPVPNPFSVKFEDIKTIEKTATSAGDYIQVEKGGYIVVEYKAVLQSNAVIGNPGNKNEVKLIYSNNPNKDGNGETPKDEVVVFTFELNVSKVDGDDGTSLIDAEFMLFTDSTVAAAVAKDPATADTSTALKFTFDKAKEIYTYDPLSTSTDNPTTATLTATAGGKYNIQGLDQGTYYLVETKQQAGYNRLTTPVKVELTVIYNKDQYETIHIPGEEDQLNEITIKVGDKDTEGNIIVVENFSGSILPSTGGVGTTIFTVLGVLLMAGSAIWLIVKRKVSADENN